MAPEMLKTKKYGPKVDVYSFGIILWEMATGKKALAEHARGCTPIQLAFKVAYENVRPRLPLNYSPTVTRLIERWYEKQALQVRVRVSTLTSSLRARRAQLAHGFERATVVRADLRAAQLAGHGS